MADLQEQLKALHCRLRREFKSRWNRSLPFAEEVFGDKARWDRARFLGFGEGARGFGIVMEDLKGIRKLYRRGNLQAKNYRARMNSWSFYELQCQIEYKARWEGHPVIYVKPHGTSSKCSMCGHRLSEENRMVKCLNCGLTIDRDVNAAKNILARGMRFVPDALPVEAMVQEPAQAVLLKVDGSEVS